jgi:hypothetical protein
MTRELMIKVEKSCSRLQENPGNIGMNHQLHMSQFIKPHRGITKGT